MIRHNHEYLVHLVSGICCSTGSWTAAHSFNHRRRRRRRRRCCRGEAPSIPNIDSHTFFIKNEIQIILKKVLYSIFSLIRSNERQQFIDTRYTQHAPVRSSTGPDICVSRDAETVELGSLRVGVTLGVVSASCAQNSANREWLLHCIGQQRFEGRTMCASLCWHAFCGPTSGACTFSLCTADQLHRYNSDVLQNQILTRS